MKPLELSVQNFGPYQGAPTVVDFQNLDRVFLIGGDTGAGKTTLFDALSYALYGKPLGIRDAKELRSQYAREEESTLVSLIFRIPQGTFRVQRSDYWVEKKARGEGFKKPASLLMVERRERLEGSGPLWKSAVTGTDSQVQQELVKLLGFTHEEFSRLLVLPQGEFQQFLEMETKDREAFLKRLFPVEDHEGLTRLANEFARELENRLKELGNRIQALGEGLMDSETRAQKEAELQAAQIRTQECQTLRDRAFQDLDAGQKLARLQEERESNRRNQELWLQTRSGIQEKKTALEAHQRAEGILPLVEQQEQNRAGRELSQKRLVELDQALARHQAQSSVLQELELKIPVWEDSQVQRDREIQKLEGRRKLYSDYIVKRDNLIPLHNLARDQGKRLEELQAKVNEARELRDRQEKLRRERDQLQAGLRESQEGLKALEALVSTVDFLEKSGSLLEDQEKRLLQLDRECQEALAERDRAQEALDLWNQGRLQQTALPLAESLEVGQPCPVCGSLDHPSPASKDSAIHWDQRKGELLRDSLATWEDRVRTSEQARAVLKDRIQGHRERHLAEEGALKASAWKTTEAWHRERQSLDLRYRESMDRDKILKDELLELEKGLAESQRREEERASLQEQLSGLEQELSAGKALLLNLWNELRSGAETELPADAYRLLDADRLAEEQRLQALKTDWENQRRELQEAQGRIRQYQEEGLRLVEARKAARQALEDWESRIRNLEERLPREMEQRGFGSFGELRSARLSDGQVVQWGREIQDHEHQGVRLQTQAESLDREIAARPAPDLQALEAALVEAQVAQREAEELRNTLSQNLKESSKQQVEWERLKKQEGELGQESREMRELADMLQGKNSLNTAFPTWILSWWLSLILERADRHMATLSAQRYRFLRADRSSDRRSRTGLDILVRDTWSSQERSLKSLSGGEKFLASVALALGMADTIQERSGGRALETLFIDEGFGSLDADTLDRALDVLDALGDQRQVGVISHVESMAQAIPSQIRVTKTKSGSRVSQAG